METTSTFILVPRNAEVHFPNKDTGGLIPTGFKTEATELQSPEVGFRKVSLIKNDDKSLEILRIAKRPTYDLILPDNRMGAITYVDYHKNIDPINIEAYDGIFLLRNRISIADKLTDLGNMIQGIGPNKKIDVYSYSSDKEEGDRIQALESITTPSSAKQSQMVNLGITSVFSKKTLINLAITQNSENESIQQIENVCITNIILGESKKKWETIFENALQTEIQTTEMDTEKIPGISPSTK